ncbi:hypothetical protein L1887_62571 [Cichorium endivia]|nr:hypothetical protein L1887_62571 [Cichorium endivia]
MTANELSQDETSVIRALSNAIHSGRENLSLSSSALSARIGLGLLDFMKYTFSPASPKKAFSAYRSNNARLSLQYLDGEVR